MPQNATSDDDTTRGVVHIYRKGDRVRIDLFAGEGPDDGKRVTFLDLSDEQALELSADLMVVAVLDG